MDVHLREQQFYTQNFTPEKIIRTNKKEALQFFTLEAQPFP